MQEEYAQCAQSGVHGIVIRYVLKYGSQTWALRKAEQNLPERTEMSVLRWMMGTKRIEKIKTDEIGTREGVANASKKIVRMR